MSNFNPFTAAVEAGGSLNGAFAGLTLSADTINALAAFLAEALQANTTGNTIDMENMFVDVTITEGAAGQVDLTTLASAAATANAEYEGFAAVAANSESDLAAGLPSTATVAAAPPAAEEPTATETSDADVAAGADPYVTTIAGELYKLDNITGVCRMIQGTVNGKPFIVNAEMKMDSQKEDDDMNNWTRNNWTGDGKRHDATHKQKRITESFFTKVFVKYGNSVAIVDFVTGNVIQSKGCTMEFQLIHRMSSLPMYRYEIAEFACSIRCGPVRVIASSYANRQIRSDITLKGASAIANADGFAARPMRTKNCRVKKLHNDKMLNMKKASFKCSQMTTFYQDDSNKGKRMNIHCV